MEVSDNKIIFTEEGNFDKFDAEKVVTRYNQWEIASRICMNQN